MAEHIRKLVQIKRVDAISPIEGADFIELAHIGGWQCVVKKNEFKVNDNGLYFEIDSFLPASDQRFEFLKARGTKMLYCKEGMRLRSIRLKGQISQGLLLPLSSFTEAEITAPDIAEALGVIKYEVPAGSNAHLRGETRRNFPSFICKTDQERVQNLTKEIKEHAGERFETTIKLDGSSMSCYYYDGDVGVCSRNVDLKVYKKESRLDKFKSFLAFMFTGKQRPRQVYDDNAFVRTAHQTGLLKALSGGKFGNIAVQGELLGPKIQKNREDLKDFQLFVFDIWNINKQRYLTPEERWKCFESLKEVANIEHIPILEKYFVLNHSVSELLQIAEGPSLNNPVREGIVFKSHDSRFSFKAVSNQFLLKED